MLSEVHMARLRSGRMVRCPTAGFEGRRANSYHLDLRDFAVMRAMRFEMPVSDCIGYRGRAGLMRRLEVTNHADIEHDIYEGCDLSDRKTFNAYRILSYRIDRLNPDFANTLSVHWGQPRVRQALRRPCDRAPMRGSDNHDERDCARTLSLKCYSFTEVSQLKTKDALDMNAIIIRFFL